MYSNAGAKSKRQCRRPILAPQVSMWYIKTRERRLNVGDRSPEGDVMNQRTRISAVLLFGLFFSLWPVACKRSVVGLNGEPWVVVEVRYKRVVPIQCPYCEDQVKLWYTIEKETGRDYSYVLMSKVAKNAYAAKLTVYYEKFNTIYIEDAKMYDPTYSHYDITREIYVNDVLLTKVTDRDKFSFIVFISGTIWQP